MSFNFKFRAFTDSFFLNEASLLPGNCLLGKVVDQTLGTPMEYVSVALYKTADSSLVSGTITNTEGTFAIEKVDEEDYYLLASFIGYNYINLPMVIDKPN